MTLTAAEGADPATGPPRAYRDPRGGLTEPELAERRRRGQVNEVPRRSSRTIGEILRANVLTRFNAILGALLVVVAIVGPYQDALFAGVLVSNTAIGIVQEVRAKRTLDRLTLLADPRVTVVRGGVVRAVDRAEVALDELIDVSAGDQIAVDGRIEEAESLELDESLLTGEADAVARIPGDEVLSGSFVAAGWGRYRATRVGGHAYAARLAEEASRFTLARSELRIGIDRILRIVTWVLVPTAVMLVWTQLAEHGDAQDAVRASVAGVVGMIPEGLVLLTSVAFAVGVVRLGRHNVLVQELPALEGLARVDVVCIDKTGTLTDGAITLVAVERVGGAEHHDVEAALGALASVDRVPNATLRAVAVVHSEPPPWTAAAIRPFSSLRKWSGASFEGHGTWVLGAPEFVLPDLPDDIATRAADQARHGRRVLLLAHTMQEFPEKGLPAGLAAAGLVLFEERVRSDARATLDYFAGQGVTVKVLSGDHPETVRSVATRLGLEAGDAVDASQLSTAPDALADTLEREHFFGRVTPHQKQAMVRALQARGHVVAMTGDGVNDALALKDADLGVAMGSGAPATRGVAQLVLLDDAFASLPVVVGEGRRVIANVERVANLFLTKTVYAFLLATASGIAGVPFPFFPRHLTIVSATTIGIPAFFLALAPSADRARPGFVGRALRFAVPAGIVVAAATLGAYALVRAEPAVGADEARTVATLVLAGVGYWVLSILARPLTGPRVVLLASMLTTVVLVFTVPIARSFFSLDLPSLIHALVAIGIVAAAGAALDLGWAVSGWLAAHRHPGAGGRWLRRS